MRMALGKGFHHILGLLGISAVIAVPILALTLMTNNLRWTLGAEKAKLMWFEHLRRGWGGVVGDSTLTDSLLLIDVHHDRQFVEDIVSGGNEAVVNHHHLYRLLQELSETGDYKYIMMDVFLDKGISQPRDTSLYYLIASMPRIVIPKAPGIMADSCLLPKSGKAQYGTALWESDFVKYPYWTQEEPSMPLMMYEELTGRHFYRTGPFLSESGKLVRSSTILTYEIVENERLMYNRYYLDMMVSDSTDSPILFEPDMARGKYVLIGDFSTDRHNTFLGDMSGTLINFNAYLSLVRGHHYLPMKLLFGLYFLFFMLVFVTIHYSRFSRMVMWLGCPFILGVVCLITYIYSKQVYDVLWATMLFYVLEKLVSIWESRNYIINKLRVILIKLNHK